MDIQKSSVRQHNALTNSFLPFTRNESRLLVGILTSLKKDKYKYTYNITDALNFLGLQPKHYKELIEAVNGLYNKSIPIKSDNPNDDEEMIILSQRKFPKIPGQKLNGKIEITISNPIKPYLFDLVKEFTSYEVESFLQLQSIHSQKLYTLLAQFKHTGLLIKKGDELQEIMGTNYKRLSQFTHEVINKSLEEIIKTTNISKVKLEPLKEGRKIIGYKFYFKWTEQLRMFSSNTIQIDSAKLSTDALEVLRRLETEFRLTRYQAQVVLDHLPLKEIRKSFREIQISKESNHIKSNIGAYSVGYFKRKYKLELA